MPKYRQLHTKILDSFDFNEMPDDFTRLLWIMLPLILDCEGRGIYNSAWLRSKMFPLRDDVELEQITTSLAWLSEREMIICYQYEDREYFYIPTFKNYQTGTHKEAESTLPEPPDQLQTNSSATPAQKKASCVVSASVLKSGIDIESVLPDNLKTPEFVDAWDRWTKHRVELKKKLTPSTIDAQIKKLNKHPPHIAIKMIERSIERGWRGLFEIDENGSKNETGESQEEMFERLAREDD